MTQILPSYLAGVWTAPQDDPDAVVVRDVPGGAVVVGVPGRILERAPAAAAEDDVDPAIWI